MKIYQTLPAFQDRNYRLHFLGQVISISGMWLQLMAQSWRVHEITHSEKWVGFITALPLGISAILTLFGGTIADRFEKRKVLYCTQIATAIQCFVLAGMEFLGYESLTFLIVLNCVFGVILAIDGPTRNSFIPELVKEENIGSGMALNGAMVMMSMMLGPGVAGSLLGLVGVGWTFLVSGLSTFAVIFTLPMMRLTHVHKKPEEHPFKMFWLGVKYTMNQPVIRLCVILSGLIGMFGFSYRAILPAVTEKIYHSGMGVMGNLMFAAGLGSLIGSVMVSAKSKKLPFNPLVIGGSLVAGVALVLFSFTSTLVLGMILLFAAGVGFTLGFSTVRAKSQIISEPRMRGRVTGFTMMLFFLGMSSGNFTVGCVAKSFSCQTALELSGVFFLTLATLMFVFGRGIIMAKPAILPEPQKIV